MTLEVHKENLKSELVNNAIHEMNEQEIALDQSFSRVIAKWLGYNLSEENIVDGSGDRGIDWWYYSSQGFDIYQIKTHELTEMGTINTTKFDNEGVMDLHRIKAFLLDNNKVSIKNSKLRHFKEQWEYELNSKRILLENLQENNETNEDDITVGVNLFLVVLGDGLTEQANAEFDAFKSSLENPIVMNGDIRIQFKVSLYTVSDIINVRWREENRSWTNIKGEKQDYINLRYLSNNSGIDGFINDSKNAVFYCPLIDLVQAYSSLGYQIFEPNVRCNIKKSKINSEIKDSIRHSSTRKEFRFLNNGVTIMCKSYTKPRDNKDYFKVKEPGIINGLQTVVSVSEAYNDLLDKNEKKDFEKNCYVLIRLLTENAVKQPEKVVRATNTQNKMEPRNLLSNTTEQILYERLFAEIGWFYERKQDSWNAFLSSTLRWRTLRNKNKSDFLTKSNGKRPRPRVISNEELAQSWFSFIGYSNHAVHDKSQIFERVDWYKLIFLKRPLKHGYDLDYQIDNTIKESINASPNHNLLLLAVLARKFAKEITLSPKENYEKSCERKKIDPYSKDKSKEEIIAFISKNDPEYLLNSALSGMSFIFAEFVGYVLFTVFEDGIHEMGNKLINNGTFAYLKNNFTIKDIRENIEKQDFEKDDILCVIWYCFKHVINEMVCSFWGESFRTHSNKSRFIAQKDTRKRIIQGLIDLNDYTCKVEFTKVWAAGIKTGEGIFGFVKGLN